MSKDSLIRFLLGTKLVSATKAGEIAEVFTLREISRQGFLLREGKRSDEYYFLERGFMRAYATDIDGQEVTTNFYSSNEVVFEVSSFFNRSLSKENIQATEDCVGWSITYDRLNGLFHALPEFREFGRAMLVRGFSALKTRMLAQITESAEQRYEALLLTNPAIFQHAQLKHIASFLGITDTSLSRIRKDYGKK